MLLLLLLKKHLFSYTVKHLTNELRVGGALFYRKDLFFVKRHQLWIFAFLVLFHDAYLFLFCHFRWNFHATHDKLVEGSLLLLKINSFAGLAKFIFEAKVLDI